MSRTPSRIRGAGIAALILAFAGPARAGDWTDKIHLGGYIQSDLRYIIDTHRGPGGRQFEMNRNDVELRLKAEPDPSVQAVMSGRLRFFGFNRAGDLRGLTERPNIDPYWFQLDEAFLAVRNVLGAPVDLKVGRMVQNWGSADLFNPTDNLSARDFWDPLDYSSKIPNQMVELNWYPADWLSLTAVWVPVFKPSQVPPSATMAFAVENGPDGCFANAPAPPLDSDQALKLKDLFGAISPCSLNFLPPAVKTVEPARTLANSQFGGRAKFRLGDLDLSLSYYYGRFSFPVAYTATAEVIQGGASGGPTFSSQQPLIQPGKTNVLYTAEVLYPRMQVAGLDFSYSAPWFFDVGIVGELAVIFPEKVTFGMKGWMNGVPLSQLTMASVNVPSTPFVKATAGLDYTFTKWLYVNAMYVRGFFDEFNDRYGVHNYVAGTAEIKFFEDEVQVRLAGAFNADDRSAVVYPQVTWIVAPSVELIGGVLAFLGPTKPSDPLDYASKSKFGQKSYGRDTAFFKAKVTW